MGHSYFLKVAEATAAERPELLEFAWRCQILPLLQECFYGQRDKLAELLSPMVDDVEGQDSGGMEAGEVAGEDLALARLARGA